jgi:hypothetical protein
MTATFLGDGSRRMIVEVATDGSARIEMSNRARVESGYAHLHVDPL